MLDRLRFEETIPGVSTQSLGYLSMAPINIYSYYIKEVAALRSQNDST